ncbi:hypothetical protein GA0074695_5649 [Micromonospora viridifaciens]|uniref:DUF4352 domain-containing protein n=1 Tax=Micromonospora viridifaciens TaxID=1881 RepID=A0A1C4ZJ03_MICVI|nr:hypothetical protein [Micromonospora viridifaciens]SCF32816.1 hypothetical protein GA0074695_5649 [Micromonospora viridifaciens]
MTATRRRHRSLAVIVNCLGVIAAIPALPAAAPGAAAVPANPAPAAAPAAPLDRATPIPTGAPAAPPAVPSAKPPPVQMPPPPVTLAMSAATTPAPGYQIQVRNGGNGVVETTVRQALPAGTKATMVTGGGRAAPGVGSSRGGEVTWRLRLPAHSTTTLHTALSTTTTGQSVTAPTCAYGTDGTRPYDCATAIWTDAAPAAVTAAAPAWWRRPPVLLAALGVLLIVTPGVVAWRFRRRQRSGGAPTGRQRSGGAPAGQGAPVLAGGAAGPAERGTVYPRPAMPARAGRRRTPPVWLMAGVAVAVLAGVGGAAAWTATQRVAAIDTAKQPTSGAWMGKSVTGAVGVPLRESAFEFTVYRVACGAGSLPSATAGGRQCLATVGVRNFTSDEQTWHGQLQRAYLADGNWVAADEDATRVANLGRDVFAQPVAAGSRVILPLVFTVRGSDQPKQLELRSGVFSAGVRVDMP